MWIVSCKSITYFSLTCNKLFTAGCVFSSPYTELLGYEDGSIGAAIIAVVLVHLIIAAYVFVAWREGQTEPTKQD